MKRYYYILLFGFIFLGCNQTSQTEKKYIQNLEEKNKILEKELEDLKTQPEQASLPKQSTHKSNAKGYFTIGSTEDEVITVMGDPDRYLDLGGGAKMFNYGANSVQFEDGRVTSYSNVDDELKVKVSK